MLQKDAGKKLCDNEIEIENMKKQEERKEGELLQVNLDLWGKDEALKEMKTREMSLQHTMEKLKQGIL